ncbi:MAG: zinc ribbon domain-containing protein [Clostridia bacterium]|nr:zinc ribbon domain-containing protein [Clostridia bacterium]MBO5078031.1 zinc ribbon domain-containing protein [Clostridia bacterium]
MALIKCPECGKEISDRAKACINCGCPIGPASNGVLRVQLNSFLKLIGNMSITVTFNGVTKRITRGYYDEFVVPADGKTRNCNITCVHGLLDGRVFNIPIQSGESKKIFITYNDGKFGSNKWEYRDELYVTK